MKSRKPAERAAPDLIKRVRDAMHTVAFGELRIKRKDKKLRVTWGETLMAPPPDSVAPPSPSPTLAGTRGVDSCLRFERTQSALANDAKLVMLAELRIMLDAHESNRKALKHLVHFERALKSAGLEAFDRVPVSVLDKVQEQLLMLAAVHREINNSKLMRAIADTIDRRLRAERSIGGDRPSDLHDSNRLFVADGRYSDFLQENESAGPIEDAEPRPAKLLP